MSLPGPAKLVSPTVEIGILSEYFSPAMMHLHSYKEITLRKCFLGNRICEGPRILNEQFDLKKRAYIGTTSMAAEVSFIMANMVLAQEGKLIYDPFGKFEDFFRFSFFVCCTDSFLSRHFDRI